MFVMQACARERFINPQSFTFHLHAKATLTERCTTNCVYAAQPNDIYIHLVFFLFSESKQNTF